jgi:glycosyltransferase involved in cell wall biosynthesis
MSTTTTDAANVSLLVSCLMVAKATEERLGHIRSSIAGFMAQSHPVKELLVLVDDASSLGALALLTAHVGGLKRRDIRVLEIPGARTLGELRNLSLHHAAGEVFCQWDDDDLYHPDRLSKQLATLIEGEHEAVYLREVMQFFPSRREIYWTNWRQTEHGGHPGTLMIRRGVPIRYPTRGPAARLGEDAQVAADLRAGRRVGYVEDAPFLFVYVSHGNNSWHVAHHEMLASRLSISRGLLLRREKAIRTGLAPFDLGIDPIIVRGADRAAFAL